MSFVRRHLAPLAATAFFIAAPSLSAQQAVPLSDYGKLPEVEDAAISPSGKHMAVLMTINGVRQILLVDDQLKPLRRMAVGESKIRSLDWLGEDRILVVSSQTENLTGFTTDKQEFFVGKMVPIRSETEIETVFGRQPDLVDSINGQYGTRLVDGTLYAYFGAIELDDLGTNMKQYQWKHGRPYLYRVDTATNRARKIADAARENEERDWVVGSRGEVAATLSINTVTGDWSLNSGTDKTIVAGNERNGRVGLVGLGYDGTTVIYSERDAENIAHWFEIPLVGGSPQPFLEDADIERLYWDDNTGHLLGYRDKTKGPVFKNPAFGKLATGIHQAFAGLDLRMVDWTPDMKHVLVRVSGKKDSGSWYAVDLGSGQAKAIAYERKALTPELVGEVSTVTYTAADGLEMDGILTLPPGKEPKNLPLVMLPHGGPHAHDTEGFDWWAQAFASQGYAVFQPNFRGSTNRGQEFKLAGYGQWGRKMQSDLSDGMAALAAKGIIDPTRACIVGASYGGYAALAGVTLQQDKYRCAVAVAPVSDITAMYAEDYRASGQERITKMALLDQLGDKSGWESVSPRRFAEKADAPILLIHGRDDTVVPYSHSTKMADRLKAAGKPYEMVTLDGEDHWLSLSATRLKMLEAAVGFVQKHNPAG